MYPKVLPRKSLPECKHVLERPALFTREFQVCSFTWQTALFINKSALLDMATEGLIQWEGLWGWDKEQQGSPSLRGPVWHHKAFPLLTPDPQDLWTEGEHGRVPSSTPPPTADQKPLTLSLTKTRCQTKLDFWLFAVVWLRLRLFCWCLLLSRTYF